MEQKNYNVDDILEEIKRKKSRREGAAAPAPTRRTETDTPPIRRAEARRAEARRADAGRGEPRQAEPERIDPTLPRRGEEAPSARERFTPPSAQAPAPRFSQGIPGTPDTPVELEELYQLSTRFGREESPVREEPAGQARPAKPPKPQRDFGIPIDESDEPDGEPSSPQEFFGSLFSGVLSRRPAEEQFAPAEAAEEEPLSAAPQRWSPPARSGGEGPLTRTEEEFVESFHRARAAKRSESPVREPQEVLTQLHPIPDSREIPTGLGAEVGGAGVGTATRSILLPPEELEEQAEEKRPRPRFGLGRGKALTIQPEPETSHAPPVEEAWQEPDEDDYNAPEDAERVSAELHTIRRGLVFRLVCTVLGMAGLLYFAFALHDVRLPLLGFMTPEEDMRIFMGVNLGILLFLTILCNTTVGGGLVSLFTCKPDSDTPVALAVVASVALGVVLVAFPEAVLTPGVHLYFPVVALGLVFNTVGKLFMVRRIEENFKILTMNGFEKYAVLTVKEGDLAHQLTRGQNLDSPVVAYSSRAGFLTNFLELSYTEDYGENLSRITSPLFLCFSLLAGGVTYFMSKNVFVSLSAFTAMLCVCAPFTTTMVGNLPLMRMANKLSRRGSMVAGYTALDHFDDVNAFLIDEKELFPKNAVILHGIKSFDQKRVDEAILDAASVICKSGGALREIFMEMIGSRENILKEVDSLVYEDGMGLSAWVGGKRVLIGNRDLMKNHSVDTPSQDYEKKFIRDGREILYLANSGELTAMFILSYTAAPDMVEELSSLSDRGVALVVHTNDPNITPRKISEVFGYPADMVSIVPAKLEEELAALRAPRERARAEMVYTGSVLSKIYALRSVLTAKGAIVLGTVLQMLGMVLGYGLIAFFAFTGAMDTLTFPLILFYQLLWAALVTLLPNLRRY